MTDQASVSIVERAIDEYKKMKEKYDIPEKYEFQILAMLELQWEFRLTSIEHTKRKMDLLKMIQDIDGRLPRDVYTEKKKEVENKDKTKVLIICKNSSHTSEISELLYNLIGKNNINLCSQSAQRGHGGSSSSKIHTNEYEIYIDKFNENYFRGFNYHTYLNLTGDPAIEEFIRERVAR